MIAACEALGLRTPQFIQTEDFRTIIYRQEKVSDHHEKVSDSTEKVSDSTEKVSDLPEKVTDLGEKVIEFNEKVTEFDEKVTNLPQKSNQLRLTAKQRKVLEFCDEMPRTAQEILDMVGVKYQTRTLIQYVTKLIYAGFLRPTTTKPNDPNRKYITSHNSSDPR